MAEINPYIRFHITCTNSPDWHEPPRLLYDCELVYVLDGEFQLRIDDRETTMRTGAVAIIGPRIDHESWTLPHQHAVRQCLHFDWNRASRDVLSPLFCPAGEPYNTAYLHAPDRAFLPYLRLISPPRRNRPIVPIIQDIFTRLEAGDLIGESLLYPVLLHLIRQQSQQQPQRVGSKSDQTIFELKQYIETYYREPLMLETFCELTRLSPSHLCQAFRRRVGMPPSKYLAYVRLEHASRLLLASDLNVSEIAQAVGFSDANYFTRLFKRKKGLSPTAFIRSHAG